MSTDAVRDLDAPAHEIGKACCVAAASLLVRSSLVVTDAHCQKSLIWASISILLLAQAFQQWFAHLSINSGVADAAIQEKSHHQPG